jgi:hypothetical protein
MFWTHTSRHILYRTCTCYICLPDDEPCGLKHVHVKDNVEIKIELSLTKVYFQWQWRKPTRCNNNGLLVKPNYLDLFQATILPFIRSIRLCTAACGMMHHTKSCSRQSNAPDEGQNYCILQPVVWYIIPQAAVHSLMLLMKGKIVAQNMSHCFWIYK